MNQRTNDPALEQGLTEMIRGARDTEVAAALIAAEQIVIGYYYDMLRAMMVRTITKAEKLELPDQEPMRRAVTEINRICAEQKRECLFSGDILSPLDLFTFASGITMPEKEQKQPDA